jgi:ubiquinol-cytochrome c reductase cytochrome b subunit
MHEKKNLAPMYGVPLTHLFRWLDARTGLRAIAKKVLDEPIPGGARFAYVFGSGLLFIFFLQVITGIALALYYTPSAMTAHTSVAYISKQVTGGAFLRSLHSYGSSAMIIVLGLHFLQTFLFGSFKGRRELLWMSGALLSFLVLGMGFTGYLLPWDQKAYFATAVGTNVIGEMPIAGNLLLRLVRGGDTIGTLTLSRFYVAHVLLIPAMLLLFIGAHVLLFRKAGPAGPVNEDPLAPKLPAETFYPRQVLLDMSFALLIMAVISALSYFRPVTLGPIANPADIHFFPRPEWYYLPMFEWLKFFRGPLVVVGVVVIPGLLAMAFFLMPFLDRRLERKPWRRPIPVLAVAVVVAGMVYLGAKSRIDDRQGPAAAQLALQAEQEKAYSAAPFEPFVESPDRVAPMVVSGAPVDPLVAEGKGIFAERGCTACHGVNGTGTSIAPSLVGIGGKFADAQLAVLLRNPTVKMRAGGMPAVDASPQDMAALLAYLGVLGTDAANVPATVRRESPPPFTFIRTSLPIASHASNDAASVGQQLFQEHACFACHGQDGAGGRAPAIAALIAKINDTQLTQLLGNPNDRMRAGGMPPFEGTTEQIASVISYLRTLPAPQRRSQSSAQLAEAELPVAEPLSSRETRPEPAAPLAVNSLSPPTPGANVAVAEAAELNAGRTLFVSQGCIACHGPKAQGTHIAPSLIGVSTRFPGDKLTALLHNPTSKMRNGGMPAVVLNDAQIVELVAYLSSLEPTPAAPTPPVSADLGVAAAQSVIDPHSPEQVPQPHEIRSVSPSPVALRGQQVFQRNACATCHGVGGLNGTAAAHELAGTASMLPELAIENLLRHHSMQMKKGGMPLTNFSEQDMKAIVAYIRTLSPVAVEQGVPAR